MREPYFGTPIFDFLVISMGFRAKLRSKVHYVVSQYNPTQPLHGCTGYFW